VREDRCLNHTWLIEVVVLLTSVREPPLVSAAPLEVVGVF
jgi:hypothetical protein